MKISIAYHEDDSFEEEVWCIGSDNYRAIIVRKPFYSDVLSIKSFGRRKVDSVCLMSSLKDIILLALPQKEVTEVVVPNTQVGDIKSFFFKYDLFPKVKIVSKPSELPENNEKELMECVWNLLSNPKLPCTEPKSKSSQTAKEQD